MDIEEGREERDISHPYHYYPFLFSACGRSYRGRMRSALRQGAGEEPHHAIRASYYIDGINPGLEKPLKYFHHFPTKRPAVSRQSARE